MKMIDRRTEEDVEEIGSKRTRNLHLHRTSLASIESLTLPLVQEVVLLADFQCAVCQKRVGDIITKINGETESVEVSVLEKKVTLTFTNAYSDPDITNSPPIHQVALHSKPLSKVAVIRRLFRSFTN